VRECVEEITIAKYTEAETPAVPMVAETFEECYEALNGSRDGIEDILAIQM